MKLSNKLHIYCLGHYLEGSGELLDLSNRMDWDNTSIRRIYKITKDIHNPYAITEVCEKSIEDTHNHKDTIYNTWGKATVLINNPQQPDLVIKYWKLPSLKRLKLDAIMDTYLFYPWCGDGRHFANCSCSDIDKHWNTSTMKIMKNFKSEKEHIGYKRYWIKLYVSTQNNLILDIGIGKIQKQKRLKKKLKRFSDFTVIKIEYSINSVGWSLKLLVSDWIFSKLGKPYQYYAVRKGD